MSDLISRQAAKSKAVYSHERHEKVVPVAELDWLPSVEPKKCGDCISRKELKQIEKAIEKLTYARQNADDELDQDWCLALDMAIKALKQESCEDCISR